MKTRLGALVVIAALLLAGCQDSQQGSGESVDLGAKPEGPPPTASVGGGDAPNNNARLKVQAQ